MYLDLWRDGERHRIRDEQRWHFDDQALEVAARVEDGRASATTRPSKTVRLGARRRARFLDPRLSARVEDAHAD